MDPSKSKDAGEIEDKQNTANSRDPEPTPQVEPPISMMRSSLMKDGKS